VAGEWADATHSCEALGVPSTNADMPQAELTDLNTCCVIGLDA